MIPMWSILRDRTLLGMTKSALTRSGTLVISAISTLPPPRPPPPLTPEDPKETVVHRGSTEVQFIETVIYANLW